MNPRKNLTTYIIGRTQIVGKADCTHKRHLFIGMKHCVVDLLYL